MNKKTRLQKYRPKDYTKKQQQHTDKKASQDYLVNIIRFLVFCLYFFGVLEA